MPVSVLSPSIHDAVARLEDQVMVDRRHFHRHPELSFQERETAAYVADRLTKLGIEHQTGVAQTGVVGHTAMLLAAAELLNERHDQLHDTVKLGDRQRSIHHPRHPRARDPHRRVH